MKKINKILYYQRLLFVSEIVQTELINWYYDNLLIGHFGIDKWTKDFIKQKYYWSSLQRDIKAFIKGYDVYLGLKIVRHKPYNNLQSLPMLTHW